MTLPELKRQVEQQLRIAEKAMADAERDHLPCTRDRAYGRVMAYRVVLAMLEEEDER